MRDPKRLADSDPTPFENRLLGAARNERIPNEMRLRMSQGLNLGAAATAAGKTGAIITLKTGALIGLGIAGITGLMVLGGGQRSGPTGARETAATAMPNPTPAATTPRPAEAPAATGPAEPISASVAPMRAAGHGLGTPSLSTTSRGREAALREEIGLLDAARAALAANAPGKALVVLGQYNHRYPNGTFAPEALALRIEALTNAGDAATARTLARRFLKAYPSSPLAERVEHLTGLGR
jgi:TolA-binding protein